MQGLETGLGDVRIDLGCGDIAVAEQELDDSQICPMVDEMRGKRVP